jgi:hypothetical protein
MSHHQIIDGRELRLCRRSTGGYWVRLADNGRTLGKVVPDRSRWVWTTTPTAYRGDGRPESANDGISDVVPGHLNGIGLAATRKTACAALVAHLMSSRAPALGFGPHPDVNHGTMRGVDRWD